MAADDITDRWSLNTKNCDHWINKTSHDVALVPLHEARVIVWCSITNIFDLGSYFFEKVSTTDIKSYFVSSDWYKTMLQNYAILELQQRN